MKINLKHKILWKLVAAEELNQFRGFSQGSSFLATLG
jgi:hypothetical protein